MFWVYWTLVEAAHSVHDGSACRGSKIIRARSYTLAAHSKQRHCTTVRCVGELCPILDERTPIETCQCESTRIARTAAHDTAAATTAVAGFHDRFRLMPQTLFLTSYSFFRPYLFLSLRNTLSFSGIRGCALAVEFYEPCSSHAHPHTEACLHTHLLIH